MAKTIGISMSESDIRKIDQYCMAHSLVRSKFMVQAALEKVYVADMADGLILFNQYYKKVFDGSVLTEEDSKLLEQAVMLLKGGLDVK